MQRPALTSSPFGDVVSCCISPPFGRLSTTRGLITYVLLTRAPLYRGRSPFSLDLHVLGAPLTFVLCQDQTLQLNPAAHRDNSFRLPGPYEGSWLPSPAVFSLRWLHPTLPF